MDFAERKALLKESLPTKRYEHSIAVYKTAKEIAKTCGVDVEKAKLAGLLHDCGREIPTKDFIEKIKEVGIKADIVEINQPILLHDKLGVYYAEHKYDVHDKEILDAILYHTTGAPHMSKLAMVIYLADILEPARDYPGVDDLRKLVTQDLEQTLFQAYIQTIKFLLDGKQLVHPNCIEAYNELAIKYKNVKK
ncbi:MAG: bis(5'-nucleosyl)-tetraphosphatase (symmetrical) YqeK [Acidaminococcaceae bacterium]|nr:bis(5'-nucleosyl)-tetraphosphatase (symmetrical) YqeK [Acidaminococcaceae bacterium]